MTSPRGEQKPKESKEPLSKTQREILAQLLAPTGHELNPEGGDLITVIQESKKPDLGTRLLYLERAMTKSPTEFNATLDKLYSPTLTEEEQKEQIDLFHCYKFINSLCCNGEMKYEFEAPSIQITGFETLPPQSRSEDISVIKHIFGRLGDTVNEEYITAEAKKMVETTIHNLKEKNKEHEKEIANQKEARLIAEEKIIPQSEWRNLLDLPNSQRISPTTTDFSASVYMSMGRIFLPGPITQSSSLPLELEERRDTNIDAAIVLAAIREELFEQKEDSSVSQYTRQTPDTSLSRYIELKRQELDRLVRDVQRVQDRKSHLALVEQKRASFFETKTSHAKITILKNLAQAVSNAPLNTDSNTEVKECLKAFKEQVVDPMKNAVAAGRPVPDPELILEAYRIKEQNKSSWNNSQNLFFARVKGYLQSGLPLDRLPELMDYSAQDDEMSQKIVVEILKEDNIKIMQQPSGRFSR